jgi:hypothetical protein
MDSVLQKHVGTCLVRVTTSWCMQDSWNCTHNNNNNNQREEYIKPVVSEAGQTTVDCNRQRNEKKLCVLIKK